MEKKKPVRVLDLVKDKGQEIEKKYEDGSDVKTLAKEYNCSNNTMMVTIGVLGYEVEPWAKDQVQKKLDTIEKNKAKRVKKAS